MAGQDPWGLGRFSYVGTQGKSGSKLLVITVYRVSANLSMKRQGPKTVYQQEWNLLRNKGDDNPNIHENKWLKTQLASSKQTKNKITRSFSLPTPTKTCAH
jgi:hypothetical protein